MNLTKDLFFSQYALATLFSVTNKLQVQGDKYLGDLTIRQMLAVPAIIHAPEGKATINHIARQLGTTKQSTKQIIDTLEKKKYLSVEQSPIDKRAVNITITPEGEKAFIECSNRTDEFLADIFCNFTAEDLETFCNLLRKLYGFDGAEQDDYEKELNFHTSDEVAVLQHHPNYLKRRINKHE